MEKISELRAQRAGVVDELKALTETMNADDYVEKESDETGRQELKGKVAAIDAKIKRIEEMNTIKGNEARALAEDRDTKAVVDMPRLSKHRSLQAFKGTEAVALPDGRAVEMRAEERAFRTGQWLLGHFAGNEKAMAWCRENGMVTRAQAGNVDTAGGYLVPEEMMNSIIVLREQYGVFRRSAFIAPMGRDTLFWPRRTGGLTATFTAEGSSVTESSATWDNVGLVAKALKVLVRFSTEIAEDAIVSIADYLTDEIAYAFASKEDDCGFNGDGTSTYGGITGATVAMGSSGLYTASGHATYDTLTNADVSKMMELLPQYAYPNAKFYMSQGAFITCFAQLTVAAGGAGRDELTGAPTYRYLGFPIVISQKLPLGVASPTAKTAILFGDMVKAAVFAERRQVTIRRSDDRYFDTDQVGLLGTERFDIVCHDVGDGTNPGPLVALKMG